MKKQIQSTSLSLKGTQILKAVAILAVLAIHVLSSIKPSPFLNQYQIFAVGLDQVSRISVPLFVALSGYGLFWKYSNKKLKLIDFFKQRSIKLLPLYFLWSIAFSLLFYFIPSFDSVTEQPNFLWKLLLGRADYHLYFVPMIFQLYVLFPLILKLFKKAPLITLLAAIAVQITWWWFFSYQGLTVTSWKYFAGDNEQYLWMTNWIAYFVLGMYLPKIWAFFDKRKIVFCIVATVFIVSGWYTSVMAVQSIQSGVDPLFALKFTRYPLFVYSFLAIITSSYLVAKVKSENKILVYLGKISYPVFLGHTLFLRIIFYFMYA